MLCITAMMLCTSLLFKRISNPVAKPNTSLQTFRKVYLTCSFAADRRAVCEECIRAWKGRGGEFVRWLFLIDSSKTATSTQTVLSTAARFMEVERMYDRFLMHANVPNCLTLQPCAWSKSGSEMMIGGLQLIGNGFAFHYSNWRVHSYSTSSV